MIHFQRFNRLGLFCLILSLVAFGLLLAALPKVDGVLDVLSTGSKTDSGAVQVSALPFYVLTEGRIIALYWTSAAFLSLMAVGFGLIAYRRQENSLGYSSAITIGFLTFLLVIQYRWVWAS